MPEGPRLKERKTGFVYSRSLSITWSKVQDCGIKTFARDSIHNSKLDRCVCVKKLADGLLNEASQMKNLGCAYKKLGMEISRNRSEFKLEYS